MEHHNNNGLIRIEAVDNLKERADAMVHAGFSQELCQVYRSVRREILDDMMRKWIHAI